MVPTSHDSGVGKETGKKVVEKKYSLVNQVLYESLEENLIDPVILTQLQAYHANGVWGLGLNQDAPEYIVLW